MAIERLVVQAHPGELIFDTLFLIKKILLHDEAFLFDCGVLSF